MEDLATILCDEKSAREMEGMGMKEKRWTGIVRLFRGLQKHCQ